MLCRHRGPDGGLRLIQPLICRQSHSGAPDNYNVPIVIPYRAVEIKVPASVAKAEPSPFAETHAWPDPSVPEPGDHRRAITNPFYQFTMPDGYENMGDSKLGKSAIIAETMKRKDGTHIHLPYDACKATTRWAKVGSHSEPQEFWITGTQNNEAIVRDLRDSNPFKVPGNLRASLSDGFYRVVTIDKFEDFGTKRVQGDRPDGDTKEKDYASAENLHDFIHGVCGGVQADYKDGANVTRLLGHMSHVPVAAFDPIFWVHHCNVDRMVAIWEVLHSGDSDNWFDGTDARDQDSGNWAIAEYHRDLPSDPLRPFHKDEEGHYWNSNDIRETAPLGYTYPGLEKWKYETLKAYINARYNSAAKAAVKARLTADPGESHESSRKPNLLQLQLATSDPTLEDDIIGFNDYIVNVVYNRFALGGHPYSIHIFVGKVPDRLPYTFDDPEGSLVGQVYTFSSPADQQGTDAEVGCANCRAQEAAEVESSGTVVLTNALITRWKNQLVHTPRQRLSDGDEGEEVPRVLASMEPQDVVPFLRTNFRWRVTSLEGLVPPEQLPSLRVSVAVGKADHYADQTKLSRFYDYRGANDVTRDRPQGAGPDDGLYPPEQDY
ncbi:hypothetical protein B0H67DRAFT_557288 [Lasiosphaeris hirsuta]|uniref:tyrosinase n=1 Tax=Lasiosphaeris hirsuta TaxID=260670 RepID=A0AA39ZVN2_9PEZI|nr:hypothetical protein B0H67DRAFT_557288 [Lasiosphaeris hirsuta]